MDKEKRNALVTMHLELLDIAKEIVQKSFSTDKNIDTPKMFKPVLAVYDKLFAGEMHRFNLHFQKGMMDKIPDVNKVLGKVFGGGE